MKRKVCDKTDTHSFRKRGDRPSGPSDYLKILSISNTSRWKERIRSRHTHEIYKINRFHSRQYHY